VAGVELRTKASLAELVVKRRDGGQRVELLLRARRTVIKMMVSIGHGETRRRLVQKTDIAKIEKRKGEALKSVSDISEG
jgi:hypothetical protein